MDSTLLAVLGPIAFAFACRRCYVWGHRDHERMWRRACEAQALRIRELEQQLANERMATWRRQRFEAVR